MFETKIKTTIPTVMSKEAFEIIAKGLKDSDVNFSVTGVNNIYNILMCPDGKIQLYTRSKKEMLQSDKIKEVMPEVFNNFLNELMVKIGMIKGNPPHPIKFYFEEANGDLGFKLNVTFECGTPANNQEE